MLIGIVFFSMMGLILFPFVDNGLIIMGAYATVNQSEYIRNMKKNQEDVRDMVLDSYQDMQDGKGRDYKEFFSELESRYHISDV